MGSDFEVSEPVAVTSGVSAFQTLLVRLSLYCTRYTAPETEDQVTRATALETLIAATGTVALLFAEVTQTKAVADKAPATAVTEYGPPIEFAMKEPLVSMVPPPEMAHAGVTEIRLPNWSQASARN